MNSTKGYVFICSLPNIMMLIYNFNCPFSKFHHFQLVDASTLKKEVAEGVDLMVVRELTGG